MNELKILGILLDANCAEGRERQRVYVAPKLAFLGDVRTITLGGSPGSGDSGAPTSQNTPGQI